MAPLIVVMKYGFLLFKIQDILYEIVPATTQDLLTSGLGNQPSYTNMLKCSMRLNLKLGYAV